MISLKKLDVIEEEKESDNLSNSDEEVKQFNNEIKLNEFDRKFSTDSNFTNSTGDFVQKLNTHFGAKDNTEFEWKSFVNIVYNLFTHQVGKTANNDKYLDIDEKTKEEYFLYILYYIKEKQFFEGEIFELWIKKGMKTLEDTNKLALVIVKKDRLKAECSLINDNSLKNLINDNSNSSTYKSFWRVYDAVLKVLRNQNFGQPMDGNQIQKPKYLSIIQHFINQYAKSKGGSEEEKALIKSGKKLNLAVYNSLVEKKLISDQKNIVKFNQTEIDKSS